MKYKDLFYFLPQRYRYMAQDKEGNFWVFTNRPTIMDDLERWKFDSYDVLVRDKESNPSIDDLPSHWKDSLIVRTNSRKEKINYLYKDAIPFFLKEIFTAGMGAAAVAGILLFSHNLLADTVSNFIWSCCAIYFCIDMLIMSLSNRF